MAHLQRLYQRWPYITDGVMIVMLRKNKRGFASFGKNYLNCRQDAFLVYVSRWREGFTLVECVLVMVLSTMILASFWTIFKVVQSNWSLQTTRGDALHEGQRTLYRMTSELKYAGKILQLSDTVVGFETRYLVDSDDEVEVIKYELSSSKLYRSVDDPGLGDMMTQLNSWSGAFAFKGYKFKAPDVLTELNYGSGDLPNDAIAIEIRHTISLYDHFFSSTAEIMNFNSLVWLRNRDK